MSRNMNRTGSQLIDWEAARLSSPPAMPESTFNSRPSGTFKTQSFMSESDYGAAAPPLFQEGPPPASDIGYIPGFLASNIGKIIRAEFFIGNNLYTDRSGRLLSVGNNYFVLEDIITHAHIMCDLYSVKFVTLMD